MKTHNIGIVGYGMIAEIHAAAVLALPNARLVGIMDRGSGRGAQIAPTANQRDSGNLRAFIARDDIDVLLVATPSGAHLDAALIAAEQRKHCLVEKPIEITVERIDKMIAAHNAAGTQLGGIFNTRYTTGAQLLKRTVDKGRFGSISYASAVGPWWRDAEYYSESSWKGTWALDGGGALINQGIHSVDLLQWLMGSRVTRVSGCIATLAHSIEVEDTAAATLQFANGAIGQIASTTSMWPGHFRTLTIGGTNGTAVLADGNLLLWQFREADALDDAAARAILRLPGTGVAASDPRAGVDADGHREVLKRFLSSIDTNTVPEIDGHEARKSVEIIRAVYASSSQGGAAIRLA
ncbi:MAG: UDP-N-acetyl-2-amino-2-deoxyglucuronate dehydrogenase [Gammaproteobacteria bacterium]|jgi:UDP-N-acetyl-2-amino-2-deoxyglucuronate dehydrogenase